MAKGLEHLSDAQIENYGTENFSEDSHAPDVEAHLEDCDDCRNRLLEHHRARFGWLAESSTNPPFHQCPSSNGPSEDDLRNVAANLMAPDEALAITEHAGQCAHCGALLRAFTEEFSDDLTEDEIKSENQFLAQLKSSSPKWQKEVAREATKANRDSSSIQHLESKSSGWSMRWVLAPAAIAATALIAFGLWFTQRDTPEKVEKLLAQAYTEHRTMEYRWPGAEWGPVRVTRGAGESHLSRPSSQLEAERILAEHEGSNSADATKDPQWLRAKAEAELQKGELPAAISDLTAALTRDPGSSRIQLLLAIAYAQQGDITGDRANREKALEILNKVISRKTPPDAAALFNRALLYRKLNDPEKARADLDELVRMEPQSAWADEAGKKPVLQR